MNFPEELKRRSVFKVGMTYVVMGWLLLQVASTLETLVELPEWLGSTIVAVLVIGFPVALIVAWAFELTAGGIKRTEDKDSISVEDKLAAASAGRKFDFVVIGFLIVGVAFLLFVRGGFLSLEPDVRDTSIAVLPFVNMSSDPEQAYFSDGISEELLNVLAQISDLHVTSRTSAFKYRGNDLHIPTVAAELGVGHVLEGSIRKSGTTVRIKAQLIEASTDKHLWSETYDRELTDIFAVQDEISAAIVLALSDALGFQMAPAPSVQQTANTEAYDKYLLAILETNQRTGGSMESAKNHLEETLALDPNFAPAHARLAIVYYLLPEYNTNYSRDNVAPLARLHASKAMELAPNAFESLGAAGVVASAIDYDKEKGLELLSQAIAVNPSFVDALIWKGKILRQQGEEEEFLKLTQEALIVDPYSPLVLSNRIDQLINRAQFDQAALLLERMQAVSPQFYWALTSAFNYDQGHAVEAAIAALEAMALGVLHAKFQFRDALRHMSLVSEMQAFAPDQLETKLAVGDTDELMADALASNGQYRAFYIGWVFMQLGQHETAYEHFTLFAGNIDLDRLDSGVLLNMGIVASHVGQSDTAATYLNKVLELHAKLRAFGMDSVWLDINEGIALTYLGREDQGLPLIRRSFEVGPRPPLPGSLTIFMKETPERAAIIENAMVRVSENRERFLSIVCNGGNPAPDIWSPLPETCSGHVNDQPQP